MGITASTVGPSKKTLFQRLGDKFPFSDEELRKLIICFQQTSPSLSAGHENQGVGTSFLSDLVVAASMHSTLPSEDNATASATAQFCNVSRISAAEKVLPLGFGDHLRMVCFQNKDNISFDDSFSMENNTQDVQFTQDERELEVFLAGVADCCRRGSRMALKVIYACACSLEGTVSAKSNTLIDLCYCIAIASEIIASSSMEAWVNETDGTSKSPEALIKVLIAHKKKEQERNFSGNYHQVSSQPIQNESDNSVSLAEFISWSEAVAPLVSAILSTFIHRVFFPTAPFPPSRTPFLFPNLSLLDQPSAFVSSASSPLLFTFGCLAKSLGGKWFRIYTSDVDGLSFNRLQHSL